jgi:hypothetical protein
LVMWSVCCWAGEECNNQPSTGAAKAFDAQYKSNKQRMEMGRRPSGKCVDDAPHDGGG